MQMRTVEISVGAFMLAGLLSLSVLALKISGLSLHNTGGYYHVYAMFNNVGTLKERAQVSIAGVVIGQVTGVTLDKKTYMARVDMKIESNEDNIPIDSSAAIVTAGLLGGKYINISIGGSDTYLKNGNPIEDTQSALVLENLIGKFLLNFVGKKSTK